MREQSKIAKIAGDVLIVAVALSMLALVAAGTWRLVWWLIP